jgi:hypothetical protein
LAVKTSGEIEQELLDNLKTTPGKDLSGWMAQIAAPEVRP